MSNELSQQNDASAVVAQKWFAAGVLFGLAIIACYKQLDAALREAERKHHRAELKRAYVSRHKWRKGDIPRLLSLGVNRDAQIRMLRLDGKGRPVVRPHQPFADLVESTIKTYVAAYGDSIPRSDRLRALKLTKWWPHYVEALYRGEHALAKAVTIDSPAQRAEEKVGKELGISASYVHAICRSVRKLRNSDASAASFPPLTVAQFDDWMSGGHNPLVEWLETPQIAVVTS